MYALRSICLLWPRLMGSSSEGVVHGSGFNLAVIHPSDRKGTDMYCIVATKDKTMVSLSHLDDSFTVYIMSSCLLQCSVCHKLNTSRCMLDSGLGVEY